MAISYLTMRKAASTAGYTILIRGDVLLVGILSIQPEGEFLFEPLRPDAEPILFCTDIVESAQLAMGNTWRVVLRQVKPTITYQPRLSGKDALSSSWNFSPLYRIGDAAKTYHQSR